MPKVTSTDYFLIGTSVGTIGTGFKYGLINALILLSIALILLAWFKAFTDHWH